MSRVLELKRPLALRRTGIRKSNPKRRAKRYAANFGDKAAYIRQLPCCICGRAAPSDPSHYPSRGAGGTSKDLTPMCRAHHNELGGGVVTFQAKYDVDLKAKAAMYHTWYNTDPQPMGF